MTGDPRPMLGVSTCLFDDHGRVLLVKRANPPYAGSLSLPGGRVRFGEMLQDAARRELREETGVTADRISFVTFHEAIGEDFHAVVAVHTGKLPRDAAPQAGDDASMVVFLDLDEIRQAEASGETTPGLSLAVSAALSLDR